MTTLIRAYTFVARAGFCAIFLMTLFFPKVVAYAEGVDRDELIRLRDNVRSAELLFENVEFEFTTKYVWGSEELLQKAKASPTAPKQIRLHLLSDDRVHGVMQNGKFRIENNASTVFEDGNSGNNTQVTAFNRSQSIFLQNKIANISPERVVTPFNIAPHNIPVLIEGFSTAIPFSILLSGQKAIFSYPSQPYNRDTELFEVEYCGKEQKDDHTCHRIECRLFKKPLKASMKPKLIVKRIYWLAEDLSFLPILGHSFTTQWSSEIPMGIVRILDCKEIKPGIWFPSHCEAVSFNPLKIKAEGKQEKFWKKEFFLTKVSLDPQYPDSYFDEVAFPEGSQIFYLDSDRKVIKHNIPVKESTPEVATERPSSVRVSRWGRLLLINFGCGAILIGVAAWRNCRQHSKNNGKQSVEPSDGEQA